MSTIIEALSAVALDVGAVAKKQRNQQQGFVFRGVDAVVNAVSGPMRKHGVIVVPEIVEKDLRESRTAKGAVMANVYVTVRYTFYGPEGDAVAATVAAESFDSGDKATAKAMSVALRTALLQTLLLPTDEPDPDLATYERHAISVEKPSPKQAAPLDPSDVLACQSVDELRALWNDADDKMRVLIEARVHELKEAPHEL